MKRLLLLAGLALALLALWSWWSSDRRAIERRFGRILEVCEKGGEEGALAIVERARVLSEAFAPGFVVLARPYRGTLTETREVIGAVEAYRRSARRVSVSARDVDVELGPGDTAEMGVTVRATGDRGGGPGAERFRARVFWVKVDGDWKIRELEVIEVLETTGLFF